MKALQLHKPLVSWSKSQLDEDHDIQYLWKCGIRYQQEKYTEEIRSSKDKCKQALLESKLEKSIAPAEKCDNQQNLCMNST